MKTRSQKTIFNCGATREPFEGVKIIFKGVKTIVKGVTKPARAKPKRVRRGISNHGSVGLALAGLLGSDLA